MSDPLDAFDNLVPSVPKKTFDPFGLPELTQEQQDAIVAEKRQNELEAAAADEVTRPALEALVESVEAFQAAPAEARLAETEALHIAVVAAEEAGLKVDRSALIEMGAIPPPPVEDLDAAPPAPAEEPEPEVSVPEPDVDPVMAAPPAPDMVPIYNPTPGVAALAYNGRRYPIGPNRVGWAHIEAANEAVGPDNCGGRLSSVGVRRLYGPEQRFVDVAKKTGFSLEVWCRKRNEGIVFMADAAWEKALRKNPKLAPPQDADDSE